MIQSRKTRPLLDDGDAFSDFDIGIIRHFFPTPVNHVHPLRQSLVKTATFHQRGRSFPAFAQTAQDFQHCPFFHHVFAQKVNLIHTQLFGQFGDRTLQSKSPFRRSVSLIGTGRHDVGIINPNREVHVVAQEQRQVF